MRSIVIAFLTIILAAFAVPAQQPAGSVCLGAAPDGVILNICEHGHGMVALPQPRLYLRVYADGRAEYEETPPYRADAGVRNFTLVLKEFQIGKEDLTGILTLLGNHEFQTAKEKYPSFRSGIDSSTETTITIHGKHFAKKIVLPNFYAQDRTLKPKYPAALFDLMERLDDLRNRAMGIVPNVPAINYCEMLKNRQMYTGKKISVYADMKLPYAGKGTDLLSRLQVEFKPGSATGGEYLYDETCEGERAKSLRVSGAVGIGLAPGSDSAKLRKQLAQLREDHFSGRARVWAEGVLREEPGEEESYPFRYRFDVSEFKDFQQMILPFQGPLEQGWIYSDTFDYDAEGMVIKLSQAVKRPGDWPVRLQWKNEKDFSAALKKSGRKHIVFRVIMRTHEGPGNKVTETVYFCEILELK